MVIDETANIEEAARNTRLSKTSDNGSGLLRRRQPGDSSIYDALLAQLQEEGGYLVSNEEKKLLERAHVGRRAAHGRRTPCAVGCRDRRAAGFSIPATAKFIIVRGIEASASSIRSRVRSFACAGGLQVRHV